MNIAFYGKGGIGKSTISANISTAFALKGKTVIQIGCDPKHDSTLTLLPPGQKIKTVIQSMDTDTPEDQIIVDGKHGIKCVEIGGPDPGLGCAGRGIITGMNVLEQMDRFRGENFDCVIYDILGDVVCGGFFEPLKRKKVEEMYIVTSGEFNSLFAANNLCRGYTNCRLQERGIKLAGIIGNCRGIPHEREIIETFCRAVGVKLIALIPRDNRIEDCTIRCEAISDRYPGTNLTDILEEICIFIESKKDFCKPVPLELEQLRYLFTAGVYENNG